MSRLRARCPDCRTLTAVALGPEYECHSCGRTFGAGLVRVPRAWGDGGAEMAAAAHLPLPYPEVAVVEERTLREQTLAIASELPERPVVLGGCCCSHTGAIEGLAARHEKLAVVWFDAHGDLHTPATTPSGNPWGMPLRAAIDSGAVDPRGVALVGARNLEPAETEFVAATGIHTGDRAIERATEHADCVYVAFDGDVLDAADAHPFMPEPGGLRLAHAEVLLRGLAERKTVAGAGVTGLVAVDDNAAVAARLLAALGL